MAVLVTRQPHEFILGNFKLETVVDFRSKFEYRIVDYEYNYNDGVDHDHAGIGRHQISVHARILTLQVGQHADVKLGQLRAMLATVRKPINFAHPRIGAWSVAVKNHEVKENGENEGFDITLELEEDTPIVEEEVGIADAQAKQLARIDAGATVEYQIIDGDSLWLIAAKLLGAGDLWPKIWEQNRRKFMEYVRPTQKPSLIYAGLIIDV